jgi:transcription initiation factor IIE alpha subunit
VLGIAKDLPGYPSTDDLLFHIIKEMGDRKDPSFTDLQLATQLNKNQEEIRSLLLKLSDEGFLKMGKITETHAPVLPDSYAFRIT